MENGIDIMRIEAEIAEMISRNDPRREAVRSIRKDLMEIDQQVDQKREELTGVLEGEVLETSLKAYRKQLYEVTSDVDLPEGSYSDLVDLRNVFERFVDLIGTEIRETTIKKSGTVRGTKIRGVKGTSWINHHQLKTRDHPDPDNDRDTNVWCPFCERWLANEASARRHFEQQHPGVFEKLLNGENIYF